MAATSDIDPLNVIVQNVSLSTVLDHQVRLQSETIAHLHPHTCMILSLAVQCLRS